MIERADAIVVLGCRILPSGRPTPAAARRAEAAAEAYRLGAAPQIIASGGRRWGSQVEAEALRRTLVHAGVPEGAVMRELWSLTTHENAIYSAALLRRIAARRVLVVTCAWHMPRALADFRAAGVDPLPLPSRASSTSLVRHTYRRAHEAVCTWLDARAMRRGHALIRELPLPFYERPRGMTEMRSVTP